MSSSFKRYRLGARVGDDLTLVRVIANAKGRHPVYIGWLHSAWAPVVCKVFRSLADAEREHAALAACAHPSVVQTFGAYEPNLLLLEQLDGITLRETMRRKSRDLRSIADALRTVVPIGAALAKAHRAGFVHLDVKPENIMIVDERPVLFDFGTARRIGGPRPGKVQGTDAYLSPEEWALGDVGPAADIYSLGVILYELLTDRLPFDRCGRQPLAGSVRSFRPGVSAELDRLVQACLSADPAERPGLEDLLPALNRQIRTGARMWPDELRLEPSAPAQTPRSQMAHALLPA
jgi:serine/threonine-protein kinase